MENKVTKDDLRVCEVMIPNELCVLKANNHIGDDVYIVRPHSTNYDTKICKNCTFQQMCRNSQ